MAFSIKHAKVSAIADGADASLVLPSDWNAALVVAGADVGGIPYCPTAATIATAANLTFGASASLSGGPQLQIGSGAGASAGWNLGTRHSAGYPGIWSTADGTPSFANCRFEATPSGTTTVNGLQTNASVQIQYSRTTIANFAGSGDYAQTLTGNAGQGLLITGGTATTDVQAISLSQTWNAAGIAFKGADWTITDTASAAGSLAFRIRGGAAGTTSLLEVTKAGTIYGGNTNFLIGCKATLANGAAAQVATITNGPTVGNPTKWIPIDDNGTTRYIPAW